MIRHPRVSESQKAKNDTNYPSGFFFLNKMFHQRYTLITTIAMMWLVRVRSQFQVCFFYQFHSVKAFILFYTAHVGC